MRKTGLADSAEGEVQLSPSMIERIIADWAPVVTPAHIYYETFRRLVDADEPAKTATTCDENDDAGGEGHIRLLDRWSPQERNQGVSGRWTLDSFVDAVTDPGDQIFLGTLLKRFAGQTQILGDHTPFWYGVRPGGGLFIYPFRLRHPPFQLLFDASGRLNIRCNWRTFPRVAGHAGFAELAALLGQHQSGPTSSVRVDGLDADALWDVAERTARVINS